MIAAGPPVFAAAFGTVRFRGRLAGRRFPRWRGISATFGTRGRRTPGGSPRATYGLLTVSLVVLGFIIEVVDVEIVAVYVVFLSLEFIHLVFIALEVAILVFVALEVVILVFVEVVHVDIV